MNQYLIENRVVFDDHLMMLFDADAKVELTTNEVELLSILLQGTVSKQAVIKQIWENKGIIVSEGSYHQLVRALRVKLEELHVDRNLIKTLPRLGLRFIGTVELLAEPVSIIAAPERVAPSAEPGHDTGAMAAAMHGDMPLPLGIAAIGTASSACVMHHAVAGSAEMTIHAAAAGPAPGQAATPTPPGRPAAMVRSAALALRQQLTCLICCVALAFWAGELAWLTYNHRGWHFEFRFQQTIDGIHYFSNGRMDQRTLLQAIGVVPPPGSFIYQIGFGPTNWLTVCPKPIQQEAEACDSYFFQKNP